MYKSHLIAQSICAMFVSSLGRQADSMRKHFFPDKLIKSLLEVTFMASTQTFHRNINTSLQLIAAYKNNNETPASEQWYLA